MKIELYEQPGLNYQVVLDAKNINNAIEVFETISDWLYEEVFVDYVDGRQQVIFNIDNTIDGEKQPVSIEDFQ